MMRVSLFYTIRTTTGASLEHSGLELPLVVELDGGVSVVFEVATERFESYGPVILEASGPVDSSRLSATVLHGIDANQEGGSPIPFVVVPEAAALQELAADALNAVAFLIGVGLSGSRLFAFNHLSPEGLGDERRLTELGSPWVAPELSIGVEIRTFYVDAVEPPVVKRLMGRPGVAIYSDSLNTLAPVARFRELWRILESAFGLQDRHLTRRLAEYQPAVDMHFDGTELEGLRTLRGRASHAASRARSCELLAVERNVLRCVGRLQALAERVILTKKTWGTPTTEVEELLPLGTYVGRDGEIIEP